MFSRYRQFDINMLLSMVNMQLRNHYASPDALASAYSMELPLLDKRLAAAGYHYQPNQNQYRLTESL